MATSERTIHHWHKKAVKQYTLSHNHRWITCLAASHIVGTNRPGAMPDLAKDLKISKRQIYNLARAGIVYRRLRPIGPEVCVLRQALTPSHFFSIGGLMVKYDIPPKTAIEYLTFAMEEGASVEAMCSLVSDLLDDNKSNEWYRRWTSLIRIASDLLQDYGLPDPIRELVATLLDEAKEIMSELDSQF